jgi:ribosomal protein S18 acetylase RimI-like enzyme
MDDRIALRRAVVAEAARVLAVVHAGFAQYRGVLRPESSALAETADSVRRKMEAGGAIVAERPAGGMLGAVLFEPEGDALYLGRLAVLPEARGQGLAARLVGAVEAEARARGCAAVTLEVRLALEDNIRLFARLGYREVGREAHPGFTEPTSMTMRKSLG